MTKEGFSNQYEIGVVGLDSYGRKLICALAQQPLKILAYERNKENIEALKAEAPAISIDVVHSLEQFVASLKQFRTVILSWTDRSSDVFPELIDHLAEDDVLIDAGSCHFQECGRRARSLAERKVLYLGLGVTYGGQASCFGPVLMVGSAVKIHPAVRVILEALATRDDGKPCVHHVRSVVGGHFVKMIHDAIEFSLRKTVLETFDLLKRTLILDDVELNNLTSAWPMGALDGALTDDCARWASQAARELGVSTPTIDAVAGTRALSEWEKRNHFTTTAFRQPAGHFGDDTESIVAELRDALSAAVMITYAEGMALLTAGSERYGFNIDAAEVIRMWKGCCNMRVKLLDGMAAAIENTPGLTNLLQDDDLSERVMGQQECLRHVLCRAGLLEVTAPALMASLDYLDFYRGAWLPINLIKAPAPQKNQRVAWEP